MASTAEIVWTSRDEQVVRTLQRTEQGMAKLIQKMNQVEGASKKQTQTTVSGFDKATAAIGKMAGALIGGGSLLTAIDMVKRANEEIIRKAEEAAHKYDELFRGFRVQAGLSELQGQKAQQKIVDVATANAVKTEVAAAGAKGLISAGFDVEGATGGALTALLRTQAAMGAAGKPVDTQNLAKQMAAYFTSQGQTPTAQLLQSAMEEAFALRAGAFELENFGEMAKYGAVFKGKLSRQEQLAAYGTLVDVMPAAEAGTSLRNIVSRLSTARVGRTSGKALAAIGLTAEQVDLVGENFGQVLDTLAGALQTVPEEQRASVLKQLFEEAGVAPASVLLEQRRGKYAGYQKGMRTSAAEFATAAGIAQQGINAAQIRQQVRAEARAEAQYDQGDLFLGALEEEAAAAGYSPARRFVARTGYHAARSFGLDPGRAAYLGYSVGIPTSGPGGVGGGIESRAWEQLSQDIRENTQATKENSRAAGGADEPRVRALPGEANGIR